MEKRGHEFFVTARDKEVVFDLLNYYKIKYVSRGSGGKSLFKKITYIFKADFKILKFARIFKPDVFLSFGSPYTAHIAFITNKPHIAFDDTDNAPFEHLLYVPFTETIITPNAYRKNFGKKQIRINSYMELCSTHDDYFLPDPSIFQDLDIDHSQPFVVIRLVAWNASHDIGLKGFSDNGLTKLIGLLQKKYKIIISSESQLPKKYDKYIFKIHPVKLQSTLFYADLFIGESLTMAVESAILGTLSFAVTSANAGVTTEQVNNGLLKKFNNEDDFFIEIEEQINNPSQKKEFQLKSKEILSEKINVTNFMIWFIENYPNSKSEILSNPNFQNNFI